MREKANTLEKQVDAIQQIIKSACNFTSRRLQIIYDNTEHRFGELFGEENPYTMELQKITNESIKVLNESGSEESFNYYDTKLENLLSKVLEKDCTGSIIITN